MSRSPHRPSGPSQRQLRVGELVRHALSEILMRGELHDPALGAVPITVPEVRMSPDLKLATAYVMPLGGDGDAKAIVKALNRESGHLRREVTGRVALKFSPELRFRVDETFHESARVDALLASDHVRQDLDREDEDE